MEYIMNLSSTTKLNPTLSLSPAVYPTPFASLAGKHAMKVRFCNYSPNMPFPVPLVSATLAQALLTQLKLGRPDSSKTELPALFELPSCTLFRR